MEIELIEIRDFLAQRPPFDQLATELLDDLPKHLEIRYLKRGSVFPPETAGDTPQAQFYILRSGAIELRDAEGDISEKLGEGDCYLGECQVVSALSGKTAEDTLLYQLSCERLRELRRADPGLQRYFTDSVTARLKQAVDQTRADSADIANLTIAVQDLLRKPPVTIDAGCSIREAAQLMSERNVSSVMLTDQGQLAGLITDRDLRSRCVAAGLSADEPARQIMTRNLQAVQGEDLVLNALMTMTRLNVHHLPVMDGERLIGMLTSTDLARHQSTNTAFVASDIRKAESVDDLIAASARLPELQMQLADSSATALHIGQAISGITDALTQRLLQMAEAELGPPPVPYVWAAGGSQARREQSSHSDQDNALIISDDLTPADAPYFEALARSVSDGLNACGFYYCPGDAMATNPKWRQPLRMWQGYFDEWIEKPSPEALMLSSIFFDLRRVAGDAELFEALQRRVLEKTRANRIFIAYMAANALQHRPPLGFFRAFVLINGGAHDDTFDIKHRGIVPITDLARVYALSEGLAPVNTTERLRAAAETPALSAEMAENLEDALEFIATLRLRHQAGLLRAGKAADNYLPPDDLSDLERTHLRDAFKVIKAMQESLANRYQAGRFR